jgi:hypothetical protein
VPDDLVTDDQRQLRIGKLAVDDVQVRTADRTGVNLQEQLALARLRYRHIGEHERLALAVENHYVHTGKPNAHVKKLYKWCS